MDEFEIELKKDFLTEAKDLLQNTEQSFLELEKDPSNKTLIDAIFRFAHNLKGTSRAVGFGEIAELTHTAENLLLEIKQGKIIANDLVVSTLLVFNDQVREMIEGLSDNLDATFDCKSLISDLEKIIRGEEVTAASASSSPECEEVEAPTDAIVEAFEEEANVIPLTAAATAAPKKEVKKEARKDDETLRVSLNRLEKLNDLVGELVILQTVVESSLSKVGENKTARALSKIM